MLVMPDAEYITVKRDENGQVGIFVGGKPATHYRGVNIYDINYVKDIFAWIQEQNPNITELHVLSSKTWGKFAKVGNGNPSFEHGENAWCRVKNNDGKLGDWVFCDECCVNLCALNCARYLRWHPAFQRAVLGTFDNGQNGKNAQSDDLGCIDWSQKLGVHNVGSYRIIVEKVGPNTK